MKVRDYQKFIEDDDTDYVRLKAKKQKTKKPLNPKEWTDEQSYGKKNDKGKKWKDR
jgi:hypothetical protein